MKHRRSHYLIAAIGFAAFAALLWWHEEVAVAVNAVLRQILGLH